MNPQKSFFKSSAKAYGGSLFTTRKARSTGRPLALKNTMHLVLRSSQAKGDWSFLKKQNKAKIAEIIGRFSNHYGVKVLSLANVGNHLHFHIQLSNRFTYRKFIKAITSAIVMKITNAKKGNKLAKKFWDYRPFTKIVFGYRSRLNLQHYIEINQLEGHGWNRVEAIDIINEYRERSSRLAT